MQIRKEWIWIGILTYVFLASLTIGFFLARGFDSMNSSLVELCKCHEDSWVTVKFPSGGEYVCAPARLPFPTKRQK